MKYRRKWPARRIRQLKALRDLVRECGSIDSANRIIDRLKRIEKLAKMLDSDWGTKHYSSFCQFLQDLAYEQIKP